MHPFDKFKLMAPHRRWLVVVVVVNTKRHRHRNQIATCNCTSKSLLHPLPPVLGFFFFVHHSAEGGDSEWRMRMSRIRVMLVWVRCVMSPAFAWQRERKNYFACSCRINKCRVSYMRVQFTHNPMVSSDRDAVGAVGAGGSRDGRELGQWSRAVIILLNGNRRALKERRCWLVDHWPEKGTTAACEKWIRRRGMSWPTTKKKTVRCGVPEKRIQSQGYAWCTE